MKIMDRVDKLSPELIEHYRGIAPATLGHLTGLRFMDSGIKPVYSDCKLVGSAFTVRAPGGIDSYVLNQIGDMLRPGDVVVVDRDGDTEHAVIGEFRAFRHLEMGVAGWIVDGAICDVKAIREMQFPTFSRTVSALVAKRVGVEGQGEVNTPINCGGVVVYPGDLIVADDDGVAVLSVEEAEALLPRMLEKEAAEVEARKQFAHLLRRGS